MDNADHLSLAAATDEGLAAALDDTDADGLEGADALGAVDALGGGYATGEPSGKDELAAMSTAPHVPPQPPFVLAPGSGGGTPAEEDIMMDDSA